MDESQPQNDVWGTVERLGGQVIKAVSDYKGRATSAPSGRVVYTNSANPFPGTQGAYPQAEAKPSPGGDSVFSLSFLSPALIIVGVVLLVLALARRG